MTYKDLDTKKVLEALSALVIGSLLFGYLSVNAYLAQYGFWDFNFLRIDYVSAGMLFLFFVTITVVIVISARYYILEFRRYLALQDRSLVKKFAIRFLQFLIGLISFGVIGFFFASFLTRENTPVNFLLVIVVTLLWVIFTGLLTSIAYSYYKDIPLRNTELLIPDIKNILKRWLSSLKLIYALFLLLTLMGMFGVEIYPFVPRYLGGGRATIVTLYFTDKTYFLSPVTVNLIYQTPDFIVFNKQNGTFLVKQDRIATMQYLENSPSWINFLNMYGENVNRVN